MGFPRGTATGRGVTTGLPSFEIDVGNTSGAHPLSMNSAGFVDALGRTQKMAQNDWPVITVVFPSIGTVIAPVAQSQYL